MPRPRIVDPCKNKGRDLGSRGVGRTYKQFDRETQRPLKFSSCECAYATVCWAGQTSRGAVERQVHAYDPEGRYPDLETVPIKSEKDLKSGQLLSAPCCELFRQPDSPGTVAHRTKLERAKVSPENTFNGCQQIEEWLFENHFVNLRAREGVGSSFDCALGAEIVGRLSEYEGFDESDFFAFLLEGRRSEITFREYHETHFDSIAATQALADHAPPQATSLQDREELLELELRREEFENRFLSYLDDLTPKQREAVELVYLHNGEGRTKTEIAAALKIRTDTLEERLIGAKKKAAGRFPEVLRAREHVHMRVALLSESVEDSELAGPIRHVGRDGKAVIRRPTPSKRNPFGEPRPREGADADAIKARFKAEESAKLHFEWSVNSVPWREPDKPEDSLGVGQSADSVAAQRR